MKSKLTHNPSLPMMLGLLFLTGCSKAVDNQAAADNAVQAPAIEVLDDPDTPRVGNQDGAAESPTDTWVGRWQVQKVCSWISSLLRTDGPTMFR